MADVYNFPKRPSPAADQAGRAVGELNYSESTLQLGSRGEAVFDVQARLRALGYKSEGKTLAVDAVFGPNTQRAVYAFQFATDGLTANGVVDAATWNALEAAFRQLPATQQVLPLYRGTGASPTNARAMNTPNASPQPSFFQSDAFKKLLVVGGGLGGVLLLSYLIAEKKAPPRRAMAGYSRFLSDVSSEMRAEANHLRRHGTAARAAKAGPRTSTRKGCSRTPASKMLVDAEVLKPEE